MQMPTNVVELAREFGIDTTGMTEMEVRIGLDVLLDQLAEDVAEVNDTIIQDGHPRFMEHMTLNAVYETIDPDVEARVNATETDAEIDQISREAVQAIRERFLN